MGCGSIYRRRLKVFSVALTIYLDYKVLQSRQKWFKKANGDALWEKAHERNAERVLQLILALKGLWVKLGQYLSTRADVLPTPYIRLLRQLQDSLPPRPLKEITDTICGELNQTMDSIFSSFVDIPLATASIAQVHRAVLTTERDVVVKVQHKGIGALILEDLKSVKSIIEWVAWAEPQYNFNPIIDEWCKEVPKELDFNLEAENTRAVRTNLYSLGKDDRNTTAKEVDVLIPEVIQSTGKLLILEYMDGVHLNDEAGLQACGVDKRKLVEEITRAYAHQIYVDGLFNGDPHPGNFLVSKEPPHRPILLDFGLTKSLPESTKYALAKMLLAASEGNQMALLSSFIEMGLKLRMDMPDQAMDATAIFFRASTPADHAPETQKLLSNEREKGMKVLKEKFKFNDKKARRFNPIDGFPGDIVFFGRVLNLLRGLSSTMKVGVSYFDIMRPYAQSVLQRDTEFICRGPVHSPLETGLRKLLHDLANDNRIVGIQVCAYKDGEVAIDTAAGILGTSDPRPVEHDSLFPVFSATKGITAGILHWLVDTGKLKLDDSVASVWPAFGASGNKKGIKVSHVLNHTSGLHNALAELIAKDPDLMTDWDRCLTHMASSKPETPPGQFQIYHYLSFGWLCGGIIEHVSGKPFKDVLDEAIVRPLALDGELYIGVPPGVESRLASLSIDADDLRTLANMPPRPDLPSTFQLHDVPAIAATLPVLFNTLSVRRSVIPAANGHCSARALARYYACLADRGVIEPATGTRLFSDDGILDAFTGTGEYADMVLNGGKFGLGFARFFNHRDDHGSSCAFGHAGFGGSIGYCDPNYRFAIGLTVNKIGSGTVTRRVFEFIFSQLGIPIPHEFYGAGPTPLIH